MPLRILQASMAFLPFLFGTHSAAQAEAAEPSGLQGRRPNIIFILTDDQGYGQLGCEGHPWLETPHIDQLRREGLAFTDFQVSPTCSPTRSALMTGNVPFKNGVTHTGGGRDRMALSAVTLPELLKKQGYATGIFGKWHLGDEEAYQPGSRGFDEVFIHGSGGIGQPDDALGKAAKTSTPAKLEEEPLPRKNTYEDPVLRLNGTFVKAKGFCTDVFFSQALSWIKKHRDKPFFAYIPTNAPHGPYIAPKERREKFAAYGLNRDQQGFYGMIENIDDNVGRLMDCLKKWDLDRDTLVIFMSDNGAVPLVKHPMQNCSRNGEPLHAYDGGLKGYKKTPHEGGTLVPAIFRWKGVLPEGGESPALAAHIDLLPTLVALAGGEVPRKIDGKSLTPLLENPAAAWPDRTLFFHIGRWKWGAEPDHSKYDKDAGFAVRTARYRLVNNEELYDVLADRGETTNLINQKPEIAKAMSQAYDAWWDEVRLLMVNEGPLDRAPNPFHDRLEQQRKSTGIPAWEEPVL